MGRFIVVEGVDGSGKTTLIQGLCVTLMERGVRFVGTREPGGTPMAERIRKELLNPKAAQFTPLQQLELLHWGRIDHVQRKIRPALDEDAIVISDRYELSSWVYQVAVDERLRAVFFTMQAELRTLLGGYEPEYILLDLAAEEVQARLSQSKKLNHFDATQLHAIMKRRTAYLNGVRELGNPFHLLDASLPSEMVLQETLRALAL